MVVCVPFAPLFKTPELMSEQVDELLYGEEVEVLDTLGGFSKIKTDYGYIGWTFTKNLFEKLHNANYTVVTPFADLLFEGKNYYQAPITLPRGARIDVGFGHDDRYGVAVLPSKRAFFIHKNHIKPLSGGECDGEALRERLCDAARSYLGVQYRWGGRTPNGVDCSGLCFMAYRLCGINIWRDADIEKSEKLKKIPLGAAKKGDLLFFENHVAMYLGEGMIIHASAKAGRVITEDYFKNEELQKIFICAGTAF